MDVTFVSVAVLLLLLLLFASYVKTSPNIAMVISGLTKKPRYLVGKGGFRVPVPRKDRQTVSGAGYCGHQDQGGYSHKRLHQCENRRCSQSAG